MRLYDDAFSPSARKVRLLLGYERLASKAFDAVYPAAGRIGWPRR